MNEIASEVTIQSSREALWRHLTRVNDWPRWYPGLHGVDTTQPVTSPGQTWRSTGQMGRMLYRSSTQVTEYRMLERIVLESDRRPWLRSIETRIAVSPEGPNCRLRLAIRAEAGLGPIGRLVLTRTLRTRLEKEATSACERLKSYVEHTLPHH